MRLAGPRTAAAHADVGEPLATAGDAERHIAGHGLYDELPAAVVQHQDAGSRHLQFRRQVIRDLMQHRMQIVALGRES